MENDIDDKIIFTNGCFDILHVGHVKLLEFCKSLDGYVIVAINSDESINLLKGSSRPINSQNSRKIMLEGIRFVDEVIIFNELTPLNIIRKIQPHIIVKGSDYKFDEVVGKDFAKIILFDYIDGYSTTKIVQNIINR